MYIDVIIESLLNSINVDQIRLKNVPRNAFPFLINNILLSLKRFLLNYGMCTKKRFEKFMKVVLKHT